MLSEELIATNISIMEVFWNKKKDQPTSKPKSVSIISQMLYSSKNIIIKEKGI